MRWKHTVTTRRMRSHYLGSDESDRTRLDQNQTRVDQTRLDQTRLDWTLDQILRNPAAGKMFTLLDFGPENQIFIITISTISMYQNLPTPMIFSIFCGWGNESEKIVQATHRPDGPSGNHNIRTQSKQILIVLDTGLTLICMGLQCAKWRIHNF